MDEYNLLDNRMRELADVIGIDSALILIMEFRGRNLNIPNKAKDTHFLVSHIGLEAFKKLCAYYGSTKLEIDLCQKLLRHKKDMEIKKGLQDGMKHGQLAMQFNCTERYIRSVKQRTKGAA